MVELTPGGVRRRRWDSKDPAALPHIVSSLPDSFPTSNYLPMVSPGQTHLRITSNRKAIGPGETMRIWHRSFLIVPNAFDRMVSLDTMDYFPYMFPLKKSELI